MTDKTKASLRKGALWLAPFLFAVGGWGGQRYDATLMKVPRFVQDSAVIMNRDSAWKAAVLDRFDRLQEGQDAMRLRLEQIQCGRRIQDGCR